MGLAQLLAGLLFGVGVFDTGVVIAVVGVTGISGVAAALLPARRAASVDPCAVLRGSG
jgi:ABC-type antimicrobial peptide transport system permease subunit